jgi:hypothetical protein
MAVAASCRTRTPWARSRSYPSVRASIDSMPLSTRFENGQDTNRRFGSSRMTSIVEGRPERAARLLGASEQLLRTIGWTFPPLERAAHDRVVASLRDALGGEGYESARGRGAAMTPSSTR